MPMREIGNLKGILQNGIWCYVWIGGASLQLIEGVFEALQTQFMSLSSEIAKEHFLMNLKDNSFENLNSEFVKGMEFLDYEL